MLERTQIQRDRQTSPPRKGLTIGPACWLFIGLIVVFAAGVTIFVSLIPLIVQKSSSVSFDSRKCPPQSIVFDLSKNSKLRDGSLPATSTSALEDIIQGPLRQSKEDAIASTKVQVEEATVSRKNSSERSRREVVNVNAELADESKADDGDQILTVKFSVFPPNKICTSNYLGKVKAALKTLSTTTYTALDDETGGTPTDNDSGRCSDTVGFADPITGATCQTFQDYRFCEEYRVGEGFPFDEEAAKANCCICGKR